MKDSREFAHLSYDMMKAKIRTLAAASISDLLPYRR